MVRWNMWSSARSVSQLRAQRYANTTVLLPDPRRWLHGAALLHADLLAQVLAAPGRPLLSCSEQPGEELEQNLQVLQRPTPAQLIYTIPSCRFLELPLCGEENKGQEKGKFITAFAAQWKSPAAFCRSLRPAQNHFAPGFLWALPLPALLASLSYHRQNAELACSFV